MKYIIIAFLLVNVSYAYDYQIKDRYGKVTGYADEEKDGYQAYDKYGRKTNSVKEDRISDKYGKTKGYISK